MNIRFSPEESKLAWQAEVGFSREHIAGKIIANGLLDTGETDTSLVIIEPASKPFALSFNYASACHKFRFTVVLNHESNPDCMNLESVFFTSDKNKGHGAQFLRNVIGLALDVGASRIFLKPGRDGSPYWTVRGAIIQDPVEVRRLQSAAKFLLSPNFEREGWSRQDENEFIALFETMDVAALHRFIDRDDLKFGQRTLRRMLLTDKSIGECVFDLDHTWTRYCLQKRVGFDVAAEKRMRGIPDRPQLLRTAFPVRGASPAF